MRSPTTPGKPNCSDSYAAGDVFCENCGYDFLSGSLPEAVAPPTHAPAASPMPASPGKVAARATVAIDEVFYGQMDPDGQLTFPDPIPDPVEINLASVVLVGRNSQSRGVFPEIGVDALNGDSAVSHRHAILRQREDGTWVVSDLDSTNGTYLDGAIDPIAPNTEFVVAAGSVINVGAWTSIIISA